MIRAPVFVSLVFAIGCSASDAPVPSGPGSLDQSHDFGTVFVDPRELLHGELEHRFEIPNTGGRPLRLAYKGSSCGCMEPLIDAPIVNPGSAASVDVKMRLAGRSEAVREYVVLTTGLKSVPEIRLTLSAVIVPRLEVLGLVNQPIRVAPGEERLVSFTVRQLAPRSEAMDPLRMEGANGDDNFSARLETVEQRGVDGAYSVAMTRVVLRLKCPKDVNAATEAIGKRTLRFISGDAEIEQPIVWVPDVSIRAQPSAIFLRYGAGTSSASRTVVLSAAAPFSITDVRSPCQWIAVEADEAVTAQEHQLTVTVPASSESQVKRSGSVSTFSIGVVTDHPDQRMLRIPVYVLHAQ